MPARASAAPSVRPKPGSEPTIFFNLGSKELKGEGAFAAAKEAEAEIQGLRAAASQDGNAPLIEVYDAALTVFTTVIASKAA